MQALAALVAAGLLGAVALPGGPGDARVDAATAVFDVASGTYRLEGGVVISRGLVRLRAGTARWNPRTGEVDASGGVLLTDATRALSTQGIHAVLDGDFEAREVVAFLKSGPVDLTGATTPAAAAACGRNALTARAGLVSGGKDGVLRLEGARVTPCDCVDGAPSWELRAASAMVHPGERVELSWPVLWITPRFLFVERPVPVFAFPWISLPLGERVSGLLVTQLGKTEVTGVTVAQPLYLVLGETADLTATPRWYFGRKRSEVASGSPSVRGPGGSLEGRWAPAVGVAGRLQVDATWDQDDEVGALQGKDGARGLRLALAGGWAQRFSERSSLRADLDLVGDPLYVRDFTPDILLRDATVRRSAAVASYRRDELTLELSTAWLEPVSSSGALATLDGGLFGAKLPALHRWPALEASLLPVALAGPLRLSGRAGLSRFAPPPGIRAGSVAGLDVLAGRESASRADARVELAAPFTLGDSLAVDPSLRGAAAGFAFDDGFAPVGAGWGSAGLVLSTGLWRGFGDLRHELTPRAEWRLTGGVLGGTLPAAGYDGWDRAAAPTSTRLAAAAPPGLSSQLRLSVATRLTRGDEELLRAEVGQEADLRRGRLAEGFVRASATRGLVSGDADLRFQTAPRLEPGPAPAYGSWLDRFSELRLRLTVADGRGDELKAGLLAVGPGGSGRLGAGVDDLFDPRPAVIAAAASGTLAAKIRLGALTAAYEVLLPVRTSVLPSCQGDGSTRVASPWEVQQQTGSLEWDSPCHCFRAKVQVHLNTCGGLGGSVSFDLGRAAAAVGR